MEEANVLRAATDQFKNLNEQVENGVGSFLDYSPKIGVGSDSVAEGFAS